VRDGCQPLPDDDVEAAARPTTTGQRTIAVIWIVGVAIGTIRALRELSANLRRESRSAR
jgi:hypothetical protein